MAGKILLWSAVALAHGAGLAQAASGRPMPPPIVTAPPEMATVLDGRFGDDCVALDLNTWQHPTRSEIDRRPEAHLKWVLLCQRRTFPVFGLDFDHDPQGQTDGFFNPLFHDLLRANGHWPYTIVAVRDGLAITVSGSRKSPISIDYADIAEAP